MDIAIPKELLKAIKEDKLIIFLGAGISINEGLPSWKNLVINLLENKEYDIQKATGYSNALKDDVMTPLDILEKIKEHKRIILESFEKDLRINNLDSELFKTLGKISKRFVTTNFDKFIEHNTGINTVITQDSDYNLSKIDTNDSYVIKIHGDIDKLDSCIIFDEQYKELYNNDKLATFQLKKLLSEFKFLFIGFSFNDPYVKELFYFMSKIMNGYGPKHYMITTGDNKIENIENIKLNNYSQLNEYLLKLKNEISEPKKEVIISSYKKAIQDDILVEEDGSDIAPNVKNWVGREKEMQVLNNDAFKVFFITGIGGEGKSALASHYLSESTKYEIIDWRDFKEEEHKFQNKILSMIEKVSEQYTAKDLLGYTNEQLINIFFKELGNKKGLFVLDNVDSYIDLVNFEPVSSIGKLFKAAISLEHNSQFIFTCRPFINFSSVDFFQLGLSGLSEPETCNYFMNGNTVIKRDSIPKYAKRAYGITIGHALWLSLILAQSRKGEDNLIQFLNNIETNNKEISNEKSSFISKNLLDTIWKSLSEQEQTVLRVLAEAIVSESIDDYAKIVDSEMNYKRFTKALKSLKQLNLIIEKRDTDYIELHPLVKDFIRRNYLLEERQKYISMFIKYYDKFVVVLKNKISFKNTYEDFTNFTKKAELSINAGNYQEAINSLYEVNNSMISAGYIEEYLRVAKLLFNSIQWTKNKIDNFTLFPSLFNATLKNFAEYGDRDYVEELLKRFENIIEDKSDSYILICSIKSYIAWFYREYPKAINIAEEAIFLLERAEQPDNYNIKDNLALALRDTKKVENIDKALEQFLLNNELENLVDRNNLEKYGSGPTYGNVGKCLFFKGQYEDALTCYSKSFHHIYTSENYQRLINLGYAALWIAEVLFEQKRNEQAYYFLRFAKEFWGKVSPVLINQNIEKFNNLEDNTLSKNIQIVDFWRVEKYCLEYIEAIIKVKFKY